MGEFVGRADVPRSKNMGIAGLKTLVDSDPVARIVLHPCRFQIETLDIGYAPGANENLVYREDETFTVLFQDNLLGRAVGPDFEDCCVIMDDNAVPFQGLLEKSGCLGVLPRQNSGGKVYNA